LVRGIFGVRVACPVAFDGTARPDGSML